MLAWLCYLLVLAVWILDLMTPQLFIASILSNVPIALSSIAFNRRLTIRLTIMAEAANIVAGYVNAAHARNQTEVIAIGDRALLAASFILVAYMATKTQDLGQKAGVARAREEQAQRERRLRFAAERVHESLSGELVMRAVATQAVHLTDALAGVFVFGPELESECVLVCVDDQQRAHLSAVNLSPEVRSLLAGVRGAAVLERSGRDFVASYALENMNFARGLAARTDGHEEAIRVLLLREAPSWTADDARMLQRFLEISAGALGQARLFAHSAEQAAHIAEQNRTLLERGAVIRDLVYALAHDLRTPLAAANVTMRQAKNGAYGVLPASYADIIDTSLQSNLDMQRNVETLLMIARYETQDWSDVREPFDFGPLIESVGREFQPAASAKGIELRASIQDGEHGVRGDEYEIRRACVNLLANAIMATPTGGHVRIAVGRDGEYVKVIVEDDGYGVPEDERHALFQRFGAGKRKRGSGTGLGLYVVRLIAERHAGSVAYEPAEQRGSRFILRLPCAA